MHRRWVDRFELKSMCRRTRSAFVPSNPEHTCTLGPCTIFLMGLLLQSRSCLRHRLSAVTEWTGWGVAGGGDPALRAAPVTWQRYRRSAKASSVRLLLMKGVKWSGSGRHGLFLRCLPPGVVSNSVLMQGNMTGLVTRSLQIPCLGC
jgi:hypothetical protein